MTLFAPNTALLTVRNTEGANVLLETASGEEIFQLIFALIKFSLEQLISSITLMEGPLLS